MATMTTTVAMEAMIDSLKHTSVMVQAVTSKLPKLGLQTSLPALRPMVLTPSTLCSTCSDLLSHNGKSSPSIRVTGTSEVGNSSSSGEDEMAHHNLDELAKEAMNGCHLCLVVYLSLDPEALKTFARTLVVDSISSPWKFTTNPNRDPDNSIGYASLIPVSVDEARLSFRYIRAPSDMAKAEKRRSLRSPASDGMMRSPFSVNSDPGGYFSDNHRSSRLSTGLPSDARSNRWSEMSSLSQFSQDLCLRVDLALFHPQRALELNIRTIPIESASTVSEDGLQIARDWIRNCTENHPDCNKTGGAKWRPTYLLDVSIRDPKNNPGVKLVDSNTLLDRRDEYVTLSHSWGPAKPIRLHKGTVEALRQGVAQSTLPRTFSDAAFVVEQLGYKYLWVDALCIMHDNEQAVLKEVSQMHNIYGNAVVNIAATCAWGDTEGFIRPRNVAALQPCLLGISGHDIGDGAYMVVKSAAWDDLVDRAPLPKRAWVLQERATAKRTIHFTRSEMLWECRQHCCSEVHPKGIPQNLKYSSTVNVEGSLTGRPDPFDKKLHHQQKGNWGRLIELYTASRLSFQSDKLLAISGLAQQYLSTNGLDESDYVVGLWKSELPRSLLWTVNRGQRPSKYYYRAPTWSWASIDGRVKCPVIANDDANENSSDDLLKPCLDVADVDVKHRYDDVFSLCQSARLRICGFLARGLLQRKRSYWGETSCSIQFPRARVRVDLPVAHFDEELLQSTPETLEIYILPVLCSSKEVQGLLLVATENRGDFVRLGTFTLPFEDKDTNRERFRTAMQSEYGMMHYENRVSHPHDDCWFSSRHKYVFTLI